MIKQLIMILYIYIYINNENNHDDDNNKTAAPEGAKRATSVSARLPRLRKGLRAGARFRETL